MAIRQRRSSEQQAAISCSVCWPAPGLFSVIGRHWGGGDAKLVAALGGWLGWQALPLLLLIASGVGLLAALLARLYWGRPLHLPLPFGPCLALAGEALLLGMLT
ncbi:A24 family peptidase [Pantoea tagorei]